MLQPDLQPIRHDIRRVFTPASPEAAASISPASASPSVWAIVPESQPSRLQVSQIVIQVVIFCRPS